MRIAIKLALALALGVAAVMIAQSYAHVSQMVEVHRNEARRDLRGTTGTLARALAEVWSHAGAEGGRAYLERVNALREETQLELVTPTRQEQEVGVRTEDGEDGHARLIAWAPVRSGGMVVATLRATRTLPPRASYVQGVLRTQLGASLAVLVLGTVLAVVLGYLLVGWPVQRLVLHARRVANGDFSPIPGKIAKDELGALARELNSMSAALNDAKVHLQQEHAEHTLTLEQLRHADRLSTVGKIASNMAHEIGTPLNVIAGRAKLIVNGAQVPEGVREHARIIAEQSARVTQTIHDTLSFARRKPLDKKLTPTAEVLRRTRRLIDPIATERSIRIEIGDDAGAEADLDQGKVLQVLTNLTMNAVQAMPEGGTITLSSMAQHVTAPPDHHCAEGDYVCFAVKDEGVGIAPDSLEEVFTPFFTTKASSGGTGLGLSVCHGIVREHGGWIDVQSELGSGSTFSVYLPVGRSASDSEEAAE